LTTLKVKKKRRRGRRQRKLHELRQRLEATRDLSERRRLIAKILRISPRASVPSD
jgi:hypothetical protein